MDYRGLSIIVCLTDPGTAGPAIKALAPIAANGGQVLAIDLRPPGRAPKWLPPGIAYQQLPKHGPMHHHLALAYNRALGLAQGDVVAFVAEDVICPPAALSRHLEVIRLGRRAVVITRVRPLRSSVTATDAVATLAAGHPLPVDVDDERPLDRLVDDDWLEAHAPWALIGDVWSAPTSALREEHGWDPAASMAVRGDEDLAWRLWRSGLPVIVDHGACAGRIARPRYPGSRWRGSALDSLTYQRGGDYVRSWRRLRAMENKVLDHNRHHSRRAILAHESLDECAALLGDSPLPDGTLAVPVFSPEDVTRALQSTERDPRTELLLLDRSPADRTHLVAAAGAGRPGVRVIRDRMTLRMGRLAALALRLPRPPASDDGATPPGHAAIESLRRGLREEGRRLGRRWPEWLAGVARGEYVRLLSPPPGSDAPYDIAPHGPASPPPQRARRRASTKEVPDDGWPRGPIEEGYAHPPRAVAVRITNRCNLRCRICGQHGPNGNLAGGREDELPLVGLQPLVEEAAAAGAGMFYIWGGEPFLRRDAVDLIAAAHRARLFTVVTTNGYCLEDLAEELVRIPLDSLRLSLDGPPEIHDRIRGVRGLFDRVMAGVRRLNACKRATGRELPALELECTICPDNYRSLREMIPIAVEAEAYALNFSHLVYATPREGGRRDALFRRLFGRPAWTWKGFCLDTDMDYHALAQTLSLLTRGDPPLPLRFTPSLADVSRIEDHYRNPEAVYGHRACCAPWIWAEVHPDGQVYFCDDFHDIAVGSIARDRLRAVWNGTAARAYRRHLLALGRFPGCINCGLLNLDGVY